MSIENKRFIPGTNPDWNLELPDEDENSLVTKNGRPWNNGYNFDERAEDEDESENEIKAEDKSETKKQIEVENSETDH